MDLVQRMINWVSGKFVKTIGYQTIFGEGNIAGGGGGGFDPTAEQLDAINSGITTEKRESYDSNLTDTTNLKTRMTTAENDIDSLQTDANRLEIEKASVSWTNEQLALKADKATSLSGYGITDAYTKTETDTAIGNKLDKRTTGTEVYSHSDGNQGGLSVKTSMSTSASDSNILTEKAVKDYIDDKDPLKWNYVGILGASSGSTLTVQDDWKELLIVGRISEGSNAYNLVQVIPKEGFTQGSPTGNVAMFGFYWNDSYKATVRIGINGTGDSRKIQAGYSDVAGWSFNGFYIYKR